MKFDMGGAGATLGAARIIAETQPQGVEVHFIIAACENMVDGKVCVSGGGGGREGCVKSEAAVALSPMHGGRQGARLGKGGSGVCDKQGC